jgi:hypothetical protein
MKRPTDAETIKRLKQQNRLLQKRLDAEVLARDQLEEELRLHRETEVSKAARASWGRPTGEVYPNGKG